MDISRQTSVVTLMVLLTACASPNRLTAPTVASGFPAVSVPAPTSAGSVGPPGPSGASIAIDLVAAASAPTGRPDVVRLQGGPRGFWAVARADKPGVSSVLLEGSADGSMWQSMDVRGFGSRLVDVASASRGTVLAEGLDLPDGGPSGSTLWFSADATHFERVPDQAALSSAFPERLFAGPAGFALLVTRLDAQGTSEPALWTSTDGRTWSEAVLPDPATIDHVVVMDAGFAAFATGRDATGIAAFASRDGRAWHALVGGVGSIFDAHELAIAAPVSIGDSIVTVRSDRTVWRGTVRPDAPTVGWTHVTSADKTFAGADVISAASSASGASMVGFDRASLHAISWTTRDGRTWERVDLGTDLFEGGVPALLARSGHTTVSVGQLANTDGDLVARPWRTDDGAGWTVVDDRQFGLLAAPRTGPCPSGLPTTPTALVSMEPSLWPTCFGHRELTISGFMGICECGGTTRSDAHPAWLIGDAAFPALRVGSEAAPDPAASLEAWIDPALRITPPPAGTKITVQGHFDDPIAPSCRIIPVPGTYVGLRPTAWLTAECRRRFVVTALQVRR